MAGTDMRTGAQRMATPPASFAGCQSNSTTPHNSNMSPFGGSPTPKSVAFELLFPESPQYRARLPMRVQIFPHDTTDSIVTTVKNFYGLYAGPGGAKGVSFEDEQGNTLIARYENLRNNMVVYVRVIEEPAQAPGAFGPSQYQSGSPAAQAAYYPSDGHQMPPPQPAQALNYGQPLSRPASRTSRKRSMSPNSRGRRSESASTNPPVVKKNRSRTGFKSRGSSTNGGFPDVHSDGLTGYSSGDGAPGSVSSRTKSEHIGNTEISLDNIVEGGRRKRAKFESSVSGNISAITREGNANRYHRNYLYLPPHKCRLRLRTLLFLLPVAWSISVPPSLSHILPNTHFRTHKPCNHLRVTAMDSDSLECILHQLLRIVVLVEQDTPTDNPLVPHQGTVLASFLLQSQRWGAACRKRIKMLRCN